MHLLNEGERELVYDNVLAEMMTYVTPDPELEEEYPVSVSGHVAEQELAAKKSETALGKLLGGMFSKPTGKTHMSIQEQGVKWYLDKPTLHIENVLEWWKRN